MSAVVEHPGAAVLSGKTEKNAKPLGGAPKRCMDLVFCLLALIALAPAMLMIAALIRLQDGGKAVYRQTRVGANGREFECLKFRSMVLDAQARLEALLSTCPDAREEWRATQKLKQDPRITPLGLFLRKSSLDELPQLFNILRGEMSLVGPRPIVPAEVVRYGHHFRHYARVRPGLTGLWQVSGRSDLSYRKRIALDVAYVRRWSILADLTIIARTLPAILVQKGSC